VVDTSHPNYEDQIGVVNSTLQEIKAFEKPIITIFNKMDLYEKQTFDPWLEEEVRAELLSELKEKWMRETNGKAVFISATEKMNLEELRARILNAVREAYQLRYPYKTEYFF
jgi:GTP-binding protein HflX